MKKRLRFVCVSACSNMGTRIQLTISAETSDLRDLISTAFMKLDLFSTDTEYYSIEHIDSVSHSYDVDE